MSNADLHALARMVRTGDLSRLDPKDHQVVELRIGADRGGGYRSQTEVAEMLGWTQAYVSQLESRARKLLSTVEV